MKYGVVYNAPFGKLYIEEENNKIVSISFVEPKSFTVADKQSELLQSACRQLTEYFSGERKKFDLPLDAHGSNFRKKVWTALQDVGYGTTASYLDIAAKIGNAKAVRAVGQANHFNPIVIVIPCHRIIGKNGKLVGYGGGAEIKTYLLNLERRYVNA